MGRLDVGGFIAGLERETTFSARCKTCGGDKREPKGTIRGTTEVKQWCPECRRPLIWMSTNPHTGKREIHEIVKLPGGHFKESITAEKGGKGIHISFD